MQNDDNERRPLSATGREMASRLQSIRDILTSDRDSGLSADEHRAALDAVDSEIADRLTEREATTYDHTLHRFAENGVNDRFNHLLERYGSTSPSSIARSRRRLNRPLDRIQRQTDRMHRLASRSEPQDRSSATLPEPSPGQSQRTRQASDEQDSDMDSHQARDGRVGWKRRKLDDGTAEQVRVYPGYGVEGTLLPGNLNMVVLEIANNNIGGHNLVDHLNKIKLPLHDNKDPYQTEHNACDILMKHSGGHPFALSKLVVKVPPRGLEAPPLQGMVFISMNRETLLSQASHYNSYLPISHSHHRRRYDSYRPSDMDYRLSARYRRPPPRPRRPCDHYPLETPWYDSRLSPSEPAIIPSRPGIKVSLEMMHDPNDSPLYGPRSPRPWEATHDYTTRPYVDRHRPSTSGRARERSSITALEVASLSGTSSEDEDDDQTQDHAGSIPDFEELGAYDYYMLNTHRDLQEAEVRQRNILAQMRMHRDQGTGYSRIPSDRQSPTYHGREPIDEDEAEATSAERADIESTLSQRGFNLEALRADTGPNEPGTNTGDSHRATSSSHRYSTKRLPGCTEMLKGQGPHSPSENDTVAPHATFSVARESGGGVAINFVPEVSGVYILVKFWAMCPNSNVSLQNIVPVGYGTVRQMADIEFN